jgi:hypothetical protein
MDDVQRYAPDTNFFFHAKSPDQLPWQDMTSASRIEVIVLDEVMRELDRHKSNGNSRSAKRARDAFTKLDPLIDDELEEVVIRSSGPQVVWRLAPFLDPSRSKPGVLDLSTADGRIVEQAYAVQQAVGNLAFLSNDRLPRRMAKAVGLASQKLPDAWLLDPETDERDKEIAKLKEELNAWSKRSPQIVVELTRDEEPIERIEGAVRRYRPLPDEFIADAMQSIELRHPEESTNVAGQITVVREAAVAKYQQERREWLEKVKDYLKRQPNRLNLEKGLVKLALTISNSGGAPAEGLSVKVWVEGPMMLVNGRMRDKIFTPGPRSFLPSPPKLERYSAFEMLRQPAFPDHVSMVHDLIRMPPRARDPDGFYWDYEKDELWCKSVEGTCQDFRHQVHEVEVPVILFFPVDAEKEPRGCLHVRWSARNLPKPIEKKYPIRLEFDWQDTEDEVGPLLIEGKLYDKGPRRASVYPCPDPEKPLLTAIWWCYRPFR